MTTHYPRTAVRTPAKPRRNVDDRGPDTGGHGAPHGAHSPTLDPPWPRDYEELFDVADGARYGDHTHSQAPPHLPGTDGQEPSQEMDEADSAWMQILTLIYAQDYVPEVVLVSVRVPCGVDHFVETTHEARGSDASQHFPTLHLVQPQLFSRTGRLHSWATVGLSTCHGALRSPRAQ